MKKRGRPPKKQKVVKKLISFKSLTKLDNLNIDPRMLET